MATRLSPEEFKTIFSKVPRLCVELVIQNKDGLLLTLRQIPPFQNMWHLPGGSVLFDETVEQAIERVALAELGVAVNTPVLLGYIDWFQEPGADDHALSLVFGITPESENFQLDYQASEYRFFKQFPDNTIPPYIKFFENLKKPLSKSDEV